MLAKTWSPKIETMLNNNKIEVDHVSDQRRFILGCSRNKFEIYNNGILEVESNTYLEGDILLFGIKFINNSKVDITEFKYNIRNFRGMMTFTN